jgi:hypothetical protein
MPVKWQSRFELYLNAFTSLCGLFLNLWKFICGWSFIVRNNKYSEEIVEYYLHVPSQDFYGAQERNARTGTFYDSKDVD